MAVTTAAEMFRRPNQAVRESVAEARRRFVRCQSGGLMVAHFVRCRCAALATIGHYTRASDFSMAVECARRARPDLVPPLLSPTSVAALRARSSTARTISGWRPAEISSETRKLGPEAVMHFLRTGKTTSSRNTPRIGSAVGPVIVIIGGMDTVVTSSMAHG